MRHSFLPKLHVLVVGPGLGRDPLVMAASALVLRDAREAGLPTGESVSARVKRLAEQTSDRLSSSMATATLPLT
jgi:hypothetical protein